jgi:nucleotide-binding universal stress UspA family protein
MKKSKMMRKVLWAIDPFESHRETSQAILDFFKLFSERYDVRIEPVYVFSPESFNLPLQLSDAWQKQYEPQLKKALAYSIQGSNDKTFAKSIGLSDPKIIRHKSRSIRASIQALLKYADSSSADLIVTGTHGRSGLDRFLLGSFAETLLLQSKLPVLVVHPGWKAKPIERILFPTDFGKSSKNTLKRVIEIARAWDAELVIHHTIERPIEPVFQSGLYLMGGGWVPLTEFLNAEEERGQELLNEYKKIAEKAGIKVRTSLDNTSLSVTSSIEEQARRENVSLIAIEARSGAARAALLGSISRQVIRNASSLVWVLRE